MKIVLINDAAQSIASFEHSVRPDDRSPEMVLILLDLVEKALASAESDFGHAEPSALLSADETVVPNEL